MYRVLSLFAGIGGFDLGLERTGGFRTVAFCETDPFCRKVLAKHWPSVPCYHDVRELTSETLAKDGIEVDCIVGGFPCQDISYAGAGAGIGGERSGLWSEYAHLIGELRPRLVIVENVSALLARGIDAVLGTLAALGLDAEWHCIPASAAGAPHQRDRIWIVAYARGEQHQGRRPSFGGPFTAQLSRAIANAAAMLRTEVERSESNGDYAGAGALADTEGSAIGARLCSDEPRGQRRGRLSYGSRTSLTWAFEPDVGRVAHGVPSRVDRLRSLGNAVVPQIPEMIGNAILAAEIRQAA